MKNTATPFKQPLRGIYEESQKPNTEGTFKHIRIQKTGELCFVSRYGYEQGNSQVYREITLEISNNGRLPQFISRETVELELKEYIELIAEQPEPLPFILETTVQEDLFQKLKECNKTLSLWLKNQVLFENLDPSLTEEKAVYYYPVAKFSKALLNLCLAIHNVAPDSMPSPAFIWYWALWTKLNNAVKVYGLTGEPELISKAQTISNSRKIIKALKKRELLFADDFTAQGGILAIAQSLAKKYSGFHEDALLPFLKEWTNYIRAFERCNHLQYSFVLLNGESFTTGGNKRLPSGVQSQSKFKREL